MRLNNSSDKTPCPQYAVHHPGLRHQQLRKQAAPQVATVVNSNIKEIKKCKRSLAASVLGVDNPQPSKLQEINRTTARIVVVDIIMRK